MKTPDEMNAEWAKAIQEAGAATEKQMSEMKAPKIKSPEELVEYICGLTDRPHDYGTCVYAMSLAAVATLNLVAHKLGVTGFQVSCADLDILRQTRDFNWGCVVNYRNLLYPQYCDTDHFPTCGALFEEHKEKLAKMAGELLVNKQNAHPNVIAHWEMLVANGKK